MTPDNGCLCVEPRSHLNGTLAARLSGDGDTHQRVQSDPTYYLPVRMNPGDAIAFTRLTVHGSGPNRTNDPRVAYALQYHRNDTTYLDKADNTWKSLKEFPRWKFNLTDKLD
jgi:2-oxoglutarate-dependent dioxygenase